MKIEIEKAIDRTLEGGNVAYKNYLEKDKYILSYINKKTRRYSAALYLATGHIGQDEPLGHNIRSKAVSLLEKVALQEQGVDEVLFALLSLLEVAAVSGEMALANVELLRKEAYVLLDLFEQMPQVEQRSFASLHRELMADAPQNKEFSLLKKASREVKESRDGGSATSRVSRGKHQEEILTALPPNSPLSISDIHALLPSIAPKTLQRELAYLVSNGALNKAGSRRWSTYTRVTQ